MSEYFTIWLDLCIAIFLFIPSIIYHLKDEHTKSLIWLVLAAIMLRMLMITLDPFLHEWDERYHALVAKHLMQHPFIPTLRENPVLDYDYKMWCCNHIWLHKQPLFLWQMALSMEVFGVNLIGLRFPDVVMGGIGVYFVYRIAQIWTGSINTAWLSALLYATANFFLELSSGRYALDHNDLAFSFYVTGSIWAFCEYLNKKSWKYVILIGVLAGAAILIKWLTGLLMFGGWFLYIILDSNKRSNWKNYIHLLVSLVICIAVFAPWQFYIMNAFPEEAAWEYEYSRKHITEVLGNGNGVFFHLKFIEAIYGGPFLAFIFIGIWQSFKRIKDHALTVSMLAMILVVYVFFSIFVETKMGAFTVPVSALLYSLIAMGMNYSIDWFGNKTSHRLKKYLAFLFVLVILVSMKPWSIAKNRNEKNNPTRSAKIHNTEIYKNLQTQVPSDYLIINCKELEDVDLMFWQPNNAYQWYPKPEEIQDLLRKGYKIAAFKSHTNQTLPEYIQKNPDIKIIDLEIH
ncbi:MAG: glycosyltransferase family 39 protein [Bacteroidota bacterium]